MNVRTSITVIVALCALAAGLLLAGPAALAAGPPVVEETSVLEVAGTSATFKATINPEENETTYRFEYGTSKAYGSALPVPDGTVGSGSSGVTVSVHPQDLLSNTTYHYRVLALVAGSGEAVDGGDGTFTTQPTGSEFELPDGRMWELVSPPIKHGAKIGSLASVGLTQAAEDGSGITYFTNVPTELEPQGYVVSSQDLSRRVPGGWSSRDIAPMHPVPTFAPVTAGSEYKLFSSELSSGLIMLEEQHGVNGENGEPLLSSEASENTPYVRSESSCDTPSGASECYLPVLTGKQGFADVPPGVEFGDAPGRQPIAFETATPDLRHVLLKSSVELSTSPAPSQTGGLYEWSAGTAAADAVQLVSVLPADEGGGPASQVELGRLSEPALSAGGHVFSNDGSRIFWVNKSSADSHDHLYLRDTAKGETLRLDVVQPGVTSPGEAKAYFRGATGDGSTVLFTDEQRLTANSDAREQEEDLYECEIVEEAGKLKCDLIDLTPENGGQSGDVINVFGISEDGSYVYFVADAVLGDGAERGATRGTCHNSALTENETVKCNLYEYHDGVTTFIGTLAGTDENDWYLGPSEKTSRVSANGRYVAFMSSVPLTGYDNRDAVSGRPDMEVYLYDAATGRLACVSCNPSGSRPTGVEVKQFDSVFGTRPNAAGVGGGSLGQGYTAETWVAANLPHGDILADNNGGMYQPRALDDSGRVFFNSSDALVPQDVNGQEDLYEFEPEGVSGCTASSVTFHATTGGCVYLISSGTSPEESGFLDASSTGADVFFLTTAKLTGQDEDTAFDIYDAHECSVAVPCSPAPVPPPPCDSGDSCKAAPAAQPSVFGAPASATFSGAGNAVPAVPAPTVVRRSLTRAQKLASALRACRRKSRKERRRCERQAKSKYAPAKTHSAAKATRKARG
ncbi:MAG TPA: hypothetical protein VNV42_09745 [Solirubrobacteraceae bacterium]|jgi:hypothetical protein|nr:hypothetical protein [Solirubrobacteraceae bacterium]